MDCHYQYLITKASRAFYLIKRNTNFITSKEVKLDLYSIYIRPIIQFGNFVAVPSKEDLIKLNKFMVRIARWICSDYSKSGINALNTANIIPYCYVQEIDNLKLIWNILNRNTNIEIPQDYQCSIYTAFISRATINYVSKSICKNDFWYRILRLLNSIPYVLDTTIYSRFINQITSIYHILAEHYYDNDNPCTWRIYCSCRKCSTTNKACSISTILTAKVDTNLFLRKTRKVVICY